MIPTTANKSNSDFDVPIFVIHLESVTLQTPNGKRYRRLGGRRQRGLTESTSSRENGLKTRRLPDVGCTM
jgi:hypothetical protein